MRLHNILLLMALLFVASCGFHLRGSQPGPTAGLSRITLTDANAASVSNEVRILLESGGMIVARENDLPGYRLHLADQAVTRSVLSVSPATGKVEEYQLTFSVLMSITDAQNNHLLTSQPVRIVRDYAFDDAAVLGSVQEQRMLEQEMTRQAASQIIRRLNAVTGN
jgi:LPS-assembly lipoprotein